jgi:hypothetical protein
MPVLPTQRPIGLGVPPIGDVPRKLQRAASTRWPDGIRDAERKSGSTPRDQGYLPVWRWLRSGLFFISASGRRITGAVITP